MTELYRYAAFVSYSSKDAAFAQRLHRTLEGYRIPGQLGAFDLIGGGKKNRIFPVFRDREELPSGELGAAIESALRASNALVIICSPNAAASEWVNKEIETFLRFGRRHRIFAIIAPNAQMPGAPFAGDVEAYFPPAFRGGHPDAGFTPIAGDARKEKDGYRNAWLKVVAGLIGVTPGQIIDRDRRRRHRQTAVVGAGTCLALSVSLIAAVLVDTAAWRTELHAHANLAAGLEDVLDATPFALAAMPAEGDLIQVGREETAKLLEKLGLRFPMRAELGEKGSIEFSPDGHFTLLQAADESYSLRDTATDSVIAELGPLNSREFSPDSSILAITDPEAQGALVAPDTGRVQVRLGWVGSLEFSPDGRRLAILEADDSWSLRDSASGAILADLGNIEDANSFGPVFFPNGKRILARTAEGEATLWDVETGQRVSNMGPLQYKQGYVVSEDMSRILINGADGFWSLHDGVSGKFIARLDEYDQYVSPAFSADTRRILTDRVEGDAVLRDARTGREIARYKDVRRTEFSPDGGSLLMRTEDSLWLVETDNGTIVARLGDLDVEEGTQFARDGSRILLSPISSSTLTEDGRSYKWELRDGKTGKLIRSLGLIGGASFWLDQSLILLREIDDEVVFQKADSGVQVANLGKINSAFGVNPMEFSPNATQFVIMSMDGELKLIDASTLATIMSLGKSDSMGGFIFSGDGRWVVVKNPDDTSVLRDLSGGEAAIQLGALSDGSSVIFSPDSRLLITSPKNGGTVVRDLNAESTVADLSNLRSEICSASGDTVRPFAWKVRTGQDPAANAVFLALRGRPWNPCDWRGLAAGLEGWAQWQRRLDVSVFGAKSRDYRCGEIDAAGNTSERRIESCRLNGVPDEFIAKSTQKLKSAADRVDAIPSAK